MKNRLRRIRDVVARIGSAPTEVPRMASASENSTATRVALSSDWQDQQRDIDWMSAPWMHQYVNALVSGGTLEDGAHWAQVAHELYLAPLAERLGRSLRMASLGCGTALHDASLISSFAWPVDRFVGLEYDDALRAAGAQRFGEEFGGGLDGSPRVDFDFRFFDFNAAGKPDETFDLVFACHSLHHATDLEGMIAFADASIEGEGLLVGIDYFGPARFQIEHDVLPLIEELYAILPEELKVMPDGSVPPAFVPPRVADVVAADPSEAPRSSDLRAMLFAHFEVVDVRPMGGTLLRWLLQYRAGNFDVDNQAHVSIARLLQVIERELIAARRIRSDDLFFVLRPRRAD